jgi:UDP-N-acetylmuramate dehydrogenase
MRPESNTPALRRLTTFGVGGKPPRFYVPRTAGDVIQILSRLRDEDMGFHVLGGGSNILVDDEGPPYPVLSTRRFEGLRRKENTVFVGVGVRLGTLLRRTAAWGLSGLEHLSGIPGTVGGALAMNAGGRDRAIGDVVDRVEFVDTDLCLKTVPGSEMGFDYRRIRPDTAVLTGATFRLVESNPKAVRAAARDAAVRKRATQPLGVRSAGCMFKNPGRIAAGMLIDRAGLKGFAVGGAVVSDLHANFIINRGEATARDIFRLCRFVQETVKIIYGIELEQEVTVWQRSERRQVSKSSQKEPRCEEAIAVHTREYARGPV